jgi:hypothetical protein
LRHSVLLGPGFAKAAAVVANRAILDRAHVSAATGAAHGGRRLGDRECVRRRDGVRIRQSPMNSANVRAAFELARLE